MVFFNDFSTSKVYNGVILKQNLFHHIFRFFNEVIIDEPLPSHLRIEIVQVEFFRPTSP
jgi:hypothetical protein